MKRFLCGLMTLSLLAGVTGEVANADLIVVPNNLAAEEGNRDNGFPFNISFPNLRSQRYQQVFEASQFATLTGSSFITQIAFRPDAFFGQAFSSTLDNVQINLSTTTATSGKLSNVFADNVGGDDRIVYSGPLSLSSQFTGPPQGPKDFDIVINLQRPFAYDPSLGNLLLDVRNFSSGSTTQFDAHQIDGSPVSRVFTVVPDGVNELSGLFDAGGPEGFVTRFTTAPQALTVTCSVAESLLWPPNHKLVNVELGATVTPPDDTLHVLIYANDNASPADAAEIGPGTLHLRSEREGGGDGRVYLIVVTASDPAGTRFDVCAVTVPHDHSRSSIQAVQQQAAAAEAYYRQFEIAPSGFVLLGESGG